MESSYVYICLLAFLINFRIGNTSLVSSEDSKKFDDFIETTQPLIDSSNNAANQHEWLSKVLPVLCVEIVIINEMNSFFTNADIQLKAPDTTFLQTELDAHFGRYSDAAKNLKLAANLYATNEFMWQQLVGGRVKDTERTFQQLRFGPSKDACKPFEDEFNQWKVDGPGPKTSPKLKSFMDEISDRYSAKGEELKQKVKSAKEMQENILGLMEDTKSKIENVEAVFRSGERPILVEMTDIFEDLERVAVEMKNNIVALLLTVPKVCYPLNDMIRIREDMLEELPKMIASEHHAEAHGTSIE